MILKVYILSNYKYIPCIWQNAVESFTATNRLASEQSISLEPSIIGSRKKKSVML